MSSVIEEPQLESIPEPEEQGPDLSVLTDKVPEQFRSPRVLAGMVLALGLVYVVCCSRPIWHTDVWGHLSYGRFIWENQTIPATEPLLPFHLVFSMYRIAIILDGVAARGEAGNAASADAGRVGGQAVAYAQRALEVMNG